MPGPSGEHAASIRVGCAGWAIASRQASLFGAGESQLARYATRFDVTEINSSFYRAHRYQTYERWAASVPTRFRFSVKVPKAITHEARLQRCGDLLARFSEETSGLGRKLGGWLVQLPPGLAYDARVANTFFAVLRRRFGGAVACEPRHASWFLPKVDQLWARHSIARVAADPPRVAEAASPGGTGSWRYWRWHGSPRIYYSAYDDERLDALAAELRGSRSAWCLFDNTAHGHAVEDALRLQARIRSS